MPGRHASPGYGGFFRDLAIFTLKVLFWGAIVFGAVLLFQTVFSSDDDSNSTSTTRAEPVSTTTAASASETTTTSTSSTTTTTTTVESTTTTTAAPTTTTLPGRDPSEVTVKVLNSTDRPGVAADLTETLAGVGYQMLEPDNWETPFTVSRVWYVAGYEVEGAVIARYVSPDAIVELFQGVAQADIIIVIGASFPG